MEEHLSSPQKTGNYKIKNLKFLKKSNFFIKIVILYSKLIIHAQKNFSDVYDI